MSKIFLILILCLLSACAKVPVSGEDMTGNYFQSGIQGTNYAKSLNTSSDLYIRGNQFTQTLTDGLCSTVISGSVRFDGSTVYLSNRLVLSATGGSCELLTDYLPIGPPLRYRYNRFDTLSDQSFKYLKIDNGIKFDTFLGDDYKLVFYRR